MSQGSGHAALMDRVYRNQRHIYDLTRRPYLLGRDQLIATLTPPPGGSVLEVGCGTGRNLIAVAERYPDAALYGVDISEAMLAQARAAAARAGLGGHVALARADATDFDPATLFRRGRFNRIFFSYTLSMIPDWRGALTHAASMLEPGGVLHVVDFGDQTGLPSWFRTGLRRWLRAFHVEPRDALSGALDQIAADHGATAQHAQLFRGYARSSTLSVPG